MPLASPWERGPPARIPGEPRLAARHAGGPPALPARTNAAPCSFASASRRPPGSLLLRNHGEDDNLGWFNRIVHCSEGMRRLDLHTEFLAGLTAQCFFQGLPRLDVPAEQVPHVGVVPPLWGRSDEQKLATA